MQSDSGSELSPAEAADELSRLGQEMRQPKKIGSLADLKEHIKQRLLDDGVAEPLTTEEQDRIADGEPYCFRCGKPASSFGIYKEFAEEMLPSSIHVSEYVRREEGTYNPATNRFACDGCYIAISMPSGPAGWLAP